MIVEWNPFLLGKDSSSWGKSATIVGDPVEVVSGSGISLSTPGNLVRLVVLGIVPGMVSLSIWGDVGCTVSNWIDSLLGKDSSSWGKSTSIIGNPVEVVSGGGVGLSTPGNLVRLVVLGIVPGMVSLSVWGDVGCAISNWIDSLLGKDSSSWGKSATIVGNPVEVVSGGGVSLSTPGDLV